MKRNKRYKLVSRNDSPREFFFFDRRESNVFQSLWGKNQAGEEEVEYIKKKTGYSVESLRKWAGMGPE